MKHQTLLTLLRVIAALFLTSFLCSCQNWVTYKSGTIKTASIQSFSTADQMTFETRGSRWMNAFGAVGAGVSLAMAMAPEEQLRTHFQSELRKALVEEINARGQFRILSDGQGEGRLEISSPGWGFVLRGAGGPFSGQTMAGALVIVILKDSSGRILWKEAAPKTNTDLMASPSYPGSELKANPALMRKELSDLARRRARQIAATLPQGTMPLAR